MNVLFITSDQQHWNTIGKFNGEISTPNLDRLCERGTYYSRAYTVNPTCTPTRATWITGLMPSQHGAWTLGTKLMEKVHTINEDFAKSNYKTALIGKAHFQQLQSPEGYESLESYDVLKDLDFWKTFNEEQTFYGFDHIELARNHTNEFLVGQHYALWLEEKGLTNWRDYFRQPVGNMTEDKRSWDIPEEFHYDTWIAERTNAKLEEYSKNDENFFLWASFLDPHPPYMVSEPWASMYDPESITVQQLRDDDDCGRSPFLEIARQETPDTSEYKKTGYLLHGVHSHVHDYDDLKKDVATYYGMVSMMDHYIGKILDKLDELGLADDTVIVFTTDHGHLYGHHGLIAKGPFMYEDLLKIPFIVSHPNAKTKGNVSTAMQSSLDIAQTFLDVCDVKNPNGMSGLSQKNVWAGNKDCVRNHVICEHNHERDSVNLRTYINEQYKMTIYYGMDCGEIFDLKNDPDELHNLWDKKEFNELKQKLMFEFLQAEMGIEPKFMPRVAGA